MPDQTEPQRASSKVVGASAALLNASSWGAGFLYLRSWGAFAFYWVGLFVLVGLAMVHVGFALALLAWIVGSIIQGWLMGRRLCDRAVSTYGRSKAWRPLFGNRFSWMPIVVGVFLLWAVAGGVAASWQEAVDEMAAGNAAHEEGDCRTAARNYERVDESGMAPFVGLADTAEDRKSACEHLTEARDLADQGERPLAIDAYAAYLDSGSASALYADGADVELAAVRASYAEILGSHGDEAGYNGAYEQFSIIVEDHPESPSASSAPDDLAAIYTAAMEWADDGQPCDAVGAAETFAGFGDDGGLSDEVAVAAGEHLPVVLVACATQLVEDGELDDAEDILDTVLLDHGGTPAAEDAAAVFVDLDERRIQEEIDDLQERAEDLPQPDAAGSAPGGVTTVEIVNGSRHDLELLYAGPETGRVLIDACPNCSDQFIDIPGSSCGTDESPVVSLTLSPGTYQMLVQVPDGNVVPFYGSWPLADATAYSECYYIQTTFG